VQVYRNRHTRDIVLFFGKTEFEGIGKGYTYTRNAAGTVTLKDGDGGDIHCRVPPRKLARQDEPSLVGRTVRLPGTMWVGQPKYKVFEGVVGKAVRTSSRDGRRRLCDGYEVTWGKDDVDEWPAALLGLYMIG